MTHAMVITAVHLDDEGKPIRYKVENSWGETPGEKGWFVMTDAWFEQFVYQVVVPKSLAPKELVKVFEGEEKVVLPPWDPMVRRCAFCSPIGESDAGSSAGLARLVGIFVCGSDLIRIWGNCMIVHYAFGPASETRDR